jgi:hypothetical protein
MISQNIIICGVVKNIGNKLKPNIDHAINTGKYFLNYKIVIYENNSTDNTKDILKLYSSNKNVKIISEDIDGIQLRENNKLWAYTEITGSSHPCRSEHISNARNKLIDEINKPEYDIYNYLIIIDLDSNGWEINGILDSFNRKDNWDVIFGNSTPHYDYCALRTDFFLFGPEIIGEPFWNLPNYNFTSNELIPVYSAFNGIGIYKKNIFRKYKYYFAVNEDLKKFYRTILKKNDIPKNIMELITNKCDKFPDGYKDAETDIFWKSNSGYIGQSICEHVPLNLALYNDGFKLFINPKMIYYR